MMQALASRGLGGYRDPQYYQLGRQHSLAFWQQNQTLGWLWASPADASKYSMGTTGLAMRNSVTGEEEMGMQGATWVGAIQAGQWYRMYSRPGHLDSPSIPRQWHFAGWLWSNDGGVRFIVYRLNHKTFDGSWDQWLAIKNATNQSVSGLGALGATDQSEYVELHEHDAPYFKPVYAEAIWDQLDYWKVADKQVQGAVETVAFAPLPPGGAPGGAGTVTEWAKRKIALGWDVALPVWIVAESDELGPECETELGAVALSPLGIDDAKAIFANLRSKCGAFLPPRAQPPAPGPQPEPQPVTPPPELKIAGIEPWAVGVLAAGAGFVLLWTLSK